MWDIWLMRLLTMDIRNKEELIEELRKIPALRYMKDPVNTVADLYAKYPTGNEQGAFALVYSTNSFYRYVPSTETADARWVQIGGSGGGLPSEITAADVSVDSDGFLNISGANVQAVLANIDNAIRSGGGMPEAPINGITHGRRNATWVPIQNTVIPPSSQVDITAMFSTNVEVPKFRVMMETYDDGHPAMIKIYAQNSIPPEMEQLDLIITAATGFGSADDLSDPAGINRKALRGIDDSGVDAWYPTPITQETETSQTTITVDKHVHDVDLKYWRGASEDPVIPTTESYYVDTLGVMHPFTAAVTPISNFYLTQAELSANGWPKPTDNIAIEGEAVRRDSIAEIYFGEDYSSDELIVNAFLFNAINLHKLEMPGFAGIRYIGSQFLGRCRSLALPDLTQIAGVEYIGVEAMVECDSFGDVDLSPLVNLKGNYLSERANPLLDGYIPCFCRNSAELTSLKYPTLTGMIYLNQGIGTDCPNLTYLDISGIANPAEISRPICENAVSLANLNIGGLNVSTWSADSDYVQSFTFKNVPNVSSSTLYATSQAGINAFKAKFPQLSNWREVVTA